MPASTALLAFAGASLVLIVIPGPSVLFVVGRAIASGRGTAVRTAVGNALGALVLVAAVAVGVGALVTRFAALFTAVKLIGAAYLVYLGVQAVRHRRDPIDPPDGRTAARGARVLWDGFVVGVTNPKTLVFFVAALPQFADPALGRMPVQLLVLGSVFVAIALASDTCYGLLAGTVRRWFADVPRRMEITRGVSGVLMIGLGAQFALTGRRG
ncbi:threonine/homoserine/homoserine lactone efflux protein [Spinactinospora alkalitolerans]|uniref:Threonine/homoserine/homoserine lactone efflux protein n=1 Tax=Spinactinospora alkalitolerans TaxID=687207 RepID=A0A852U386_9ACTN|nr:LysE family translocator [Spinactinospora alkalitolerans]NYE50659.1 threonine/homoserine/homoserine lactone efflux protein [Spinactinospora alkalitolerans]